MNLANKSTSAPLITLSHSGRQLVFQLFEFRCWMMLKTRPRNFVRANRQDAQKD
jgi:hypothetical protein